MVKGEPTSGWPAEDEAGWDTACKLLEAGQYERVAELLRESQVATERTGNPTLADILAAAQQICLACDQCHTEAKWHLQAYEEAARREHELKRELNHILHRIGGRRVPEVKREQSDPATARRTDMGFNQGGSSQREERPGLWQRVRGLLAWDSSPRSTEREALGESAEAPALPPAEKAATPAGRSAQESGTPALPPAEQPEVPAPSPAEKTKKKQRRVPSLASYCFGQFRVYQNDELITAWNGLKGQSILKFLVAHVGEPIRKDILMDVFWSDADPEAARRNLHQAIYNLRQTLRQGHPDFQYIQFEHDCYLLNPEMDIWIDFAEYERHIRAGRRLEAAGQLTDAMEKYSIAEGLYEGDFLEEDLYEDWPRLQREHLRSTYLGIADRLSEYYVQQGQYTAAIALCHKVLAHDNCYEEAHRRLIQCYLAQAQRHLAVRQYQTCVQALKEELDLTPSDETVALYRRIIAAL
ncbi:MAG: BTAD domain-containing putative transcriptional regulator [Anaerolineae bacterium]